MATQEQKNASVLGEQAIALAEQLGRMAGTVEGTAESWLNRQSLTDQLARVRDGAAELLDSLAGGAARGREAAIGGAKTVGEELQRTAKTAVATASSAAQSASSMIARRTTRKKKAKARAPAAPRRADAAHAPGKQRRKPAPSARGVKKSDLRIPKLRTAEAVRQRRKSHA